MSEVFTGSGAAAGAVAAPISQQPGLNRAAEVADAVLYEGHTLYPYRQSSGKNRVRWQFGVLTPRAWVEARGPVVDGVAGSTESWWQQTECLLEAPPTAHLQVRVRHLQLQARTVQERGPGGSYRSVARLDLEDRSEVTFDEAVPHEHDVVVKLQELLGGERTIRLEAPAGEAEESLRDQQGVEQGRVRRSRQRIDGLIRICAEPVRAPFPVVRVSVRVENALEDVPADIPRTDVLAHCLLATHSFLAVDSGAFLSQMDPPEWASAAAADCSNVRTFPVLAGAPGSRGLLLSSPIILYDHPEVAPESPGDLHDATEIDEILSLRTLTLTDEEKAEARATDPRAAAIVDRVDSMPVEIMERLHGAIRTLRPARAADADGRDPEQVNELGAPATRWWDPGAASDPDPQTDTVTVAGVPICRGSRVRLRPRRRGTDAHDMFLAGRAATVERVLLDVNDVHHVAVTIEDDPSAELHQWYGRFHYYRLDEIEPLGTASP